MQCPRCHTENREGRRFCGECGLSFASTCASCGFLNEGGEKFWGGLRPVAEFIGDIRRAQIRLARRLYSRRTLQSRPEVDRPKPAIGADTQANML